MTFDIFSRKVITWSVGAKINTELVISKIKKVILVRKLSNSVIFLIEQGSQYIPISLSLSTPGCPCDNTVTELYMKKEELHRRCSSSLQEVQLSCFEHIHIEGLYNNLGLHRRLNMLKPNKMDDQLFLCLLC